MSAPIAFILSYGDIIDRSGKLSADSSGSMQDTEAIVSVKRDEDVSKGGAVFVNARFELIDLREKPKPGEPISPWYNAGSLRVSAEYLRIHRRAAAFSSR